MQWLPLQAPNIQYDQVFSTMIELFCDIASTCCRQVLFQEEEGANSSQLGTERLVRTNTESLEWNLLEQEWRQLSQYQVSTAYSACSLTTLQQVMSNVYLELQIHMYACI